MSVTDHTDDEQTENQPDRYPDEEETVGTVNQMLETFKTDKARWTSRLTRAAITTGAAITVFTTPAAASHGSVNCSIPKELSNLFSFLHSLEQLALVAGVVVGGIGLIVAAILIEIPGQDYTRRGKAVAKHTLIGVVLLLSANLVMAYLISQFPVC